jgi:large subunit ribosomal protein L24
MKIKKDDKVIIIAGKDKGKQGTVVKALPKEDKVVVEGMNLAKKHKKGGHGDKSGGVVAIAMPIHISNVALIDPKTKKATRVRLEKKGGKITRVATKSGSVIK